MIPIFMVALACVGFALNLFSDSDILLRHPQVRKAATLSSRWTRQQGRRLLAEVKVYKAELDRFSLNNAADTVKPLVTHLLSYVKGRGQP